MKAKRVGRKKRRFEEMPSVHAQRKHDKNEDLSPQIGGKTLAASRAVQKILHLFR